MPRPNSFKGPDGKFFAKDLWQVKPTQFELLNIKLSELSKNLKKAFYNYAK